MSNGSQKPIDVILDKARQIKASDIHFTVDIPPKVRLNGKLTDMEGIQPLSADNIKELANSILRDFNQKYIKGKDFDLCYVGENGLRQRVNIYTQFETPAISIRLLNDKIPTFESLNLPEIFKQLAMLPRGLLLVTGPTGSGKSTTLAAMIDYINERKKAHILTFEDPIEYKHQHKRAMVNQREVGVDVKTYADALKSALREDPDVILVGEMRDIETITSAVTAAETGHYVFSTLHTTGASSTIDRIIDVFPSGQQEQIQTLLATTLRGVISQTLIPRKDGNGRVAAFEIMIVNDAVANMIREGKCHQIDSLLQTGMKTGMISLDMYLAQLVKNDVVDLDDAIEKCVNERMLRRYVEAAQSQ